MKDLENSVINFIGFYFKFYLGMLMIVLAALADTVSEIDQTWLIFFDLRATFKIFKLSAGCIQTQD